MNRHLPRRPDWTCTLDGHPWPCRHARAELHAIWQHNPVGVALHMSERLYEAVAELPEVPPRELYHRFLSWTRY